MSAVFKVFVCFILALLTTMAVRFALKEKRDLWFKRSPPRSFITLRTPIAMHFALGYPVKKQGYVVSICLLLAILCEILFVAYVF